MLARFVEHRLAGARIHHVLRHLVHELLQAVRSAGAEPASASREAEITVQDVILRSMRGEAQPFDFAEMRKLYKGNYMANLGYDKVRGNAAIASGHADVIAYGVPFIANPDLVRRYKTNAPLNAPKPDLFYGGDEKGYTDYPFLTD